MKLRIRTFLVGLAMAGSAILAHAQSVAEFTLHNGMKVMVMEDNRAPVVVHMVWYKVGSIDETNGTTGVSHALEHMMFKGTKKLAPGEFSRIVASLGGRENAFTSYDYTGYFQQVEKSRLEQVMALEADRMGNLQLSKDEFGREMKVIMEERRMRTDDNPFGVLNEMMNATVFKAHPYHHPVIGWMNDLENLTVDDVLDWYGRWYAPNNATLVVVGDVKAEDVKKLAEKYYGVYASKALPARKPQREPAQLGVRRFEVSAPAENPYVELNFRVPRIEDVNQDTEPYALGMLAAVLDGYSNARLTANLVRRDRIATDVSADYAGLLRGEAAFSIGGAPVKGVSVETLEQRLRAEIRQIADKGVSEEELQRVKSQIIASQVYKQDSVYGRAMEIGSLAMRGVSYDQQQVILDKYKAVTSDQVRAVAAKYFGDAQMTVGRLVPQTGAQKTTPQAGAAGGLR